MSSPDRTNTEYGCFGAAIAGLLVGAIAGYSVQEVATRGRPQNFGATGPYNALMEGFLSGLVGGVVGAALATLGWNDAGRRTPDGRLRGATMWLAALQGAVLVLPALFFFAAAVRPFFGTAALALLETIYQGSAFLPTVTAAGAVAGPLLLCARRWAAETGPRAEPGLPVGAIIRPVDVGTPGSPGNGGGKPMDARTGLRLVWVWAAVLAGCCFLDWSGEVWRLTGVVWFFAPFRASSFIADLGGVILPWVSWVSAILFVVSLIRWIGADGERRAAPDSSNSGAAPDT